jgi:hypothetical protein
VVPLVFKTSLGAVRSPEGSTPSLLRHDPTRNVCKSCRRCLKAYVEIRKHGISVRSVNDIDQLNIKSQIFPR